MSAGGNFHSVAPEVRAKKGLAIGKLIRSAATGAKERAPGLSWFAYDTVKWLLVVAERSARYFPSDPPSTLDQRQPLLRNGCLETASLIARDMGCCQQLSADLRHVSRISLCMIFKFAGMRVR
jgi:hypothetical protein